MSWCCRAPLEAGRWAAVTGAGAVAALAAALAGGGAAAAHAHQALLAAAKACPPLRAPLLAALLNMDAQAHAQGTSLLQSQYPGLVTRTLKCRVSRWQSEAFELHALDNIKNNYNCTKYISEYFADM